MVRCLTGFSGVKQEALDICLLVFFHDDLKTFKEQSMKRTFVAVGVIVALFAGILHAQAPKPYPELKQLEPFVGQWSSEGEAKATPVGKAGKFSSTAAVNWILGGFFLQWQFSGKTPDGEFKGIEVDSYDPKNKIFRAQWWNDDGSLTTGTYTPRGNVIEFSGKTVTPDKQYDVRQRYTFSADGMSYTYKDEVSMDGKTWIPWYESKGTKVKGPKK
jgi:hypothetical protein